MNFPAADLADTLGTNITAFWNLLVNAQKLVSTNLYLQDNLSKCK